MLGRQHKRLATTAICFCVTLLGSAFQSGIVLILCQQAISVYCKTDEVFPHLVQLLLKVLAPETVSSCSAASL